jgi:hypothetical protein
MSEALNTPLILAKARTQVFLTMLTDARAVPEKAWVLAFARMGGR